ncbi:MAG: serpin family protein [Clostridia bacterium]|nr:serpin family protein [Clostridia bacterium]
MKNKLLLTLCLALLMCLCSCVNTNAPSEDTNLPIQPANNIGVPLKIEFTGASFADSLMLCTKADGNRMLSPYSAKMCLALLANGAEGETKEEILNAIGISDLDAYNDEVKALLSRYESYAAALSLNTANSLWLNQSAFSGKGKFIADYREKMVNFYSADAREVTNENSVEEVNKWANEKTNGKIKEILREEHRNFAAVLANAVYFKAAWKTAFSENLTAKGEFTNADGTISITDFMHNTDTFGYYENDGIKAVKLDYSRYGDNEEYVSDEKFDFSMYFILSDGDVRVEEFLNSAEFVNSKVRLAIPKFELEYDISLTEILKSLGMQKAFSDDADLSAMLEESAKIDDVLQKTYIKIDENGTEAAAVTAIMIKLTSAMVDDRPIKEFIADKPFSFAVKDNTSGEILFVGRYENAK